MNDEIITCANPDCRISESNKCVEGLDITECPHFGRPPEFETVQIDDSSGVSLGLPLSSGAALSAEDANVLLRRGESRLVAIIGPRETGKTSLVAGLYDLFQLGEVDGVGFAGSSTLHAFELACHDARDASRRGIPHMERTQRGEVLFYHLELNDNCAESNLTLLLADRSGEEYSEIADDISTAGELPEILRADAITILIDGGRLLDNGQRHNIKSDVIMILQGLIDANAINASQRLALVLTKLDLIIASPHAARVENDFRGLGEHLLATFPKIIPKIRLFRIAASPAIDADMRGRDVNAVLRFWLEPTPAPAAEVTHFPPIALKRMFARVAPLEEEREGGKV